MARTAVIAGTATERVEPSEPPPGQSLGATGGPPTREAPPAAPQPAAAAPDPIAQLKELGALHEQGVLTDEEFAAQKAKLLG